MDVDGSLPNFQIIQKIVRFGIPKDMALEIDHCFQRWNWKKS
jgi:hypothetical protein